jgi:hypothetical protein
MAPVHVPLVLLLLLLVVVMVVVQLLLVVLVLPQLHGGPGWALGCRQQAWCWGPGGVCLPGGHAASLHQWHHPLLGPLLLLLAGERCC